jgi:ribonucleoside-diphosphate reductase beta chain
MILEGVYFFNGFLTFYAINRMTGKLQGSTDNIQYIQRDEETHLEIFINAFLSCKQETPELFTPQLYEKIKQRFIEAAELEASWGKFLIEKGLPGVNEDTMEAYPRYLVNKRAASIGIDTIFPLNTTDPVPWVLEQYSNINNGKKNFFESKPLTYTETNPTFGKKKVRQRLTATGDSVLYS